MLRIDSEIKTIGDLLPASGAEQPAAIVEEKKEQEDLFRRSQDRNHSEVEFKIVADDHEGRDIFSMSSEIVPRVESESVQSVRSLADQLE